MYVGYLCIWSGCDSRLFQPARGVPSPFSQNIPTKGKVRKTLVQNACAQWSSTRFSSLCSPVECSLIGWWAWILLPKWSFKWTPGEPGHTRDTHGCRVGRVNVHTVLYTCVCPGSPRCLFTGTWSAEAAYVSFLV